jgi:hypothetical protein
MLEPSDWENGVLAAARWLRSKGHADLAGQLIRQIPTDQEGTEDRVVDQIAKWMEQMAGASRVTPVAGCRQLAADIRERRWRMA